MDVPGAHAALSPVPRPRPRPDRAASPLALVADVGRPADERRDRGVPPVTAAREADADSPDAQLLGELFARAAGGDVGAFETLYRQLHGALRDFAETYVRSREHAEEIVQDIFLAVWETRATLRLRGSIKGYFYVSVRNRALNQLKRWQAEQRSTDRLTVEGAGRVVDDSVVERLAHEELVAEVRREVEALPPRTRQAYRLYYEHELSYAEIAAVMGTAVKTVENQLARALRHLYGALGKAAR